MSSREMNQGKMPNAAKNTPWWLLGALAGFSVAVLAAFGALASNGIAFVLTLMAGVAAATGGMMMGFLFAIPSAGAPGPNGADGKGGNQGLGYQPSTHLEEVVDWLTKIIVGVGLVELKGIGRGLVAFGLLVVDAVKPQVVPGVGLLAQLTVVDFAVIGFLASFVWTRLHYPAIQVGTDLGVLELLRGLQDDIKSVAEVATAPVDAGVKVQIEPPPESSGSEDVVFSKIAEFQKAPKVFESDPNFVIFAGYPTTSKTRKITGRIDKSMQRALILSVRVEAIGESTLDGETVFLTHPTLDSPVRRVACINNSAETQFYSEGTFHVVAVMDEGKTVLMLDLNDVPGIPKWFRDV